VKLNVIAGTINKPEFLTGESLNQGDGIIATAIYPAEMVVAVSSERTFKGPAHDAKCGGLDEPLISFRIEFGWHMLWPLINKMAGVFWCTLGEIFGSKRFATPLAFRSAANRFNIFPLGNGDARASNHLVTPGIRTAIGIVPSHGKPSFLLALDSSICTARLERMGQGARYETIKRGRHPADSPRSRACYSAVHPVHPPGASPAGAGLDPAESSERTKPGRGGPG